MAGKGKAIPVFKHYAIKKKWEVQINLHDLLAQVPYG
jgi:hypothetical protein